MNAVNNNVRFDLPEYVTVANADFAGCEVTVEYDSNFNGRGDTVMVSGVAEYDAARLVSESDTLVVDGKHIRSNGHVFSGKDGRHLGTVENVTVTLPQELAVELVTQDMSHDIDTTEESVVVQTWDDSMTENQGFMAGSDEIRMECV